MHNSPKIKAFTLSEMMVVLVITVIVVGLAFSVLRLVQRQMGAIGANYENTNELNLLRQALWVDFQTYPYLTYNEGDGVLRCANEMEFREYRISKQWIIREKDTFRLQLDSCRFYRHGEGVVSGSFDALRITTVKEEGGKVIFVHQNNAADEYMQ